MRLWSIHPKYLDSKRLTAQWREALLCRSVLDPKSLKNYKNHPQFLRVKNHPQPYYFINYYLATIWDEANKRNFKYDKSKLFEDLPEKYGEPLERMAVNNEQLEYEFRHNLLKLNEFSKQSVDNHLYYEDDQRVIANPAMISVPGPIMDFESVDEKTLKNYLY